MEAKNKDKFKILFLCSGNSARSIFAEYLMNHCGGDKFEAYSAGSEPRDSVNPMAVRVLREVHRIDASDARSKSWDEFIDSDIDFDFVITVCDHAKGTCPTWPGQPIAAHWGSRDPVGVEGTEEEIFQAFKAVSIEIRRRIDLLVSFPFEKLDHFRLEQLTLQIGSGTDPELDPTRETEPTTV